jgi:hypothetical protein
MWEDWIKVGHALVIGRTEALKIAGTNRPVGTTYNAAMGTWLREHDLADLSAQERHSLFRIMENIDAIEQWRNGLPAEQRRKHNHPATYWVWRKAISTPRRAAAVRSMRPKKGYGHAIHWPQHVVRACAMAMRDSRSGDWFQLARVGLEAAIGTDEELLALLSAPKTSPPPINGNNVFA